ncbi:hypothetical protein EYB45_08500 [Erythrobacteraceae bacterium CFH 75059]|uniref:hypothetical protein n=1 Tax=Qipengyuania thermophila TaxID=2509361 RepID=UPI00101FDC0D|nr:hypothetical protein [Qipengyuania thermophila]TCD04278.1 hypothetical protein EYB45_08500 [Erythrobacteraceae bacterium CFH 75059]
MFDITSQAASDTSAIHLKGLDGEHLYDDKGNPVRIVVYGPGSRQFAQVEARQTARAIKRMEANDGKLSVASPEQRDAETAEDLAAITVAFENFDYPPAKGKPDAERFAALYLDRSLGFITKQVTKHLNDWGNFKNASPAD